MFFYKTNEELKEIEKLEKVISLPEFENKCKEIYLDKKFMNNSDQYIEILGVEVAKWEIRSAYSNNLLEELIEAYPNYNIPSTLNTIRSSYLNFEDFNKLINDYPLELQMFFTHIASTENRIKG